MVTIENFSQAVEYKFTGGSTYGWNCFGADARWLDSEHEHYSASIVFSTDNQCVYIAEVCDYTNRRAYRWIHPAYKEEHDDEAAERGADRLQAWDDVKYTELDVAEDFLEKCRAIALGKDYDTRVSIPVDFTDAELLQYMMLAHERDMTFNAFIEEALRAAIEEAQRDPEGLKARAQKFIAERA